MNQSYITVIYCKRRGNEKYCTNGGRLSKVSKNNKASGRTILRKHRGEIIIQMITTMFQKMETGVLFVSQSCVLLFFPLFASKSCSSTSFLLI